MSEMEVLRQALEREQQARKKAEQIIEQKTAELHTANQELVKLNKQLEQEIEARTEETIILARLPEEIPDPVMRISRWGEITYTNKAYKDYWLPYLELQEGTHYPPIFQDDIFKAIVEHAPQVAKYTFGERSWSVQFNAVEQYGYINIMARDVTEQRMAEEAMHKSQEALLEAQELGNLGRWEFNMKAATFSWSPQLFRQYGYNPAEPEPAGGDFLLFIHPDDLTTAQNSISKAMSEGYSQFEQRILRPDGTIRYLVTTVKTEFGADAEPSRIYGTSLDVTELRQAEKQLGESEERFQLALQGMNDGLWDWNLENNTVYLSPQWKSLLGFHDEELENSYENFARFIYPEDLKKVQQQTDKQPPVPRLTLSYQMRMMHRDGSWRHFMIRCIILRNEQGKLSRMVGANTDITERINTEQKLINSLNQMKILSRISFMFNSVSEDFEKPIQQAIELIGNHSGVSRVYVFENSSDGIFASNTFEWCREGISPLIEALQNIPYSALQAFRKALKKQGIIASSLEEVSPTIQALLSKQGVKSLMIMPFFVQDELEGFVGFDDCVQQRQWESADVELLRTFTNLIGNIFERQQSEYKVLHSEEKYRSLVDNLTEVIFQTDPEDKITFLNPAWLDITGYQPEESIGQSLSYFMAPQDRQEFLSYQQLLFDRKTDFFRQVMRIQGKEGIRYVEVFARLIEGKWGEAEGLSGTLTDVSEQHETNLKLIQAKEGAEKASQIKAQFLSIMSHEIRTPLNAMLGISHLLIRRQPRPDQEENLRMLKFSGENLLSLINDILDFNKIESGKITIEKSAYNLQKLCHGLQKALSLKANEKNIALQLVIDRAIPAMIIGDATRLTQILNNLLDNAIKFTHKGIVKLSVKMCKQTEAQAQLEFIVSDSGIGIPQESLNSIFEAFTQVHQINNHQYGGTGLGLAIIKRLLELQGSKIEVSSSPGKGTRFSFKLAVGIANEQEQPVLSESESAPVKKSLQEASLLLVEDNPLNLLVLVQFCELWGIQPDVAENGLQAFEKVQEFKYDLVLMDLHMPVLDGIEATRRIREELGLTDLPIIALTANALPGIRQKVLEAGMNDYLSKPFEPEDLYQKVMRYIPQAKGDAAALTPASKLAKSTAAPRLYSLHKLYQQSNNNSSFVARMQDLFIKTCGEQLKLLRRSLYKGEATAVRDIAHRLKPSIDLFDIRSQIHPVRKLELMELSELETAEGRKLADDLITNLQLVMNQMQESLNKHDTLKSEA